MNLKDFLDAICNDHDTTLYAHRAKKVEGKKGKATAAVVVAPEWFDEEFKAAAAHGLKEEALPQKAAADGMWGLGAAFQQWKMEAEEQRRRSAESVYAQLIMHMKLKDYNEIHIVSEELARLCMQNGWTNEATIWEDICERTDNIYMIALLANVAMFSMKEQTQSRSLLDRLFDAKEMPLLVEACYASANLGSWKKVKDQADTIVIQLNLNGLGCIAYIWERISSEAEDLFKKEPKQRSSDPLLASTIELVNSAYAEQSEINVQTVLRELEKQMNSNKLYVQAYHECKNIETSKDRKIATRKVFELISAARKKPTSIDDFVYWLLDDSCMTNKAKLYMLPEDAIIDDDMARNSIVNDE